MSLSRSLWLSLSVCVCLSHQPEDEFASQLVRLLAMMSFHRYRDASGLVGANKD